MNCSLRRATPRIAAFALVSLFLLTASTFAQRRQMSAPIWC
jgi:hypothetical protein